MTWNTSLGDRILTGAEASFYLTILQDAVEASREAAELGEELGVQTGDRIFDLATFEQRLILWQQCLEALTRSEAPAPALTNVLEAAAYFPFAFLQMRVREEITLAQMDDSDDWNDYRRLILETIEALEIKHSDQSEEEEISSISLDCDEPLQWEESIEVLMDRIFYDRDWQLTQQNPQLLDGIEESLAHPTGITTDYFQNRLPKVTAEQAKLAIATILDWTP